MSCNVVKSKGAIVVSVVILVFLLLVLLLTCSDLFTFLGKAETNEDFRNSLYTISHDQPALHPKSEYTSIIPTIKSLILTDQESYTPTWNWSSNNKARYLFDHHLYIPSQSRELTSTEWIEQRLNHFNVADTRTWLQRYFVNDSFYEFGGPAFLMVSGENPADSRWIEEGQWLEWARETHAICFLLEHRYYGESQPTTDTQLKNLRYLNTAQALADLANFRTLMTEEYNLHESKWISIGSYYAGSLAVFLRLKYPHLIDGAIATGPILKNLLPKNSIKSFSEYNIFDPDCSAAIDEGIGRLKQISRKEWHTFSKKFRLCKMLEIYEEVKILVDLIENHFLSTNTNVSDEIICGVMTDKNNGNAIDKIGIINSLVLDSLGEPCLEISFNKISAYLNNPNWKDLSTENGERQWLYQMCTELGGLGRDNFYWKCATIFGRNAYSDYVLDIGSSYGEINPFDHKLFNMFYGSENLEISNSVLITHPKQYWLQKQLFPTVNNETVKVVHTQNISEFSEMEASSSSDSIELIQTREIIYRYIVQWT